MLFYYPSFSSSSFVLPPLTASLSLCSSSKFFFLPPASNIKHVIWLFSSTASFLLFSLSLSVVFLFCFVFLFFVFLSFYILPQPQADIDLLSDRLGQFLMQFPLSEMLRRYRWIWLGSSIKNNYLTLQFFSSFSSSTRQFSPFSHGPGPSSRLFSCNYNNRSFATRTSQSFFLLFFF